MTGAETREGAGVNRDSDVSRAPWKGRRIVRVLLPVTAAAAAVSVVVVSAAVSSPTVRHASPAHGVVRSARATSAVEKPPGAAGFAEVVVRTSTAYAVSHGDGARITNVDCVQASSGHYMCSYAVTRATGLPECHLMQAAWTPNSASVYTVTLAGRVRACDTLQQALHTLP